MDDGYEIFATLTFDLSDDDLAAVVAQLGRHRPATLYPEAWRRLTDELRRRRFAHGETRVDVSAAVFEDLPDEVQASLRGRQVGSGRDREAAASFGREPDPMAA